MAVAVELSVEELERLIAGVVRRTLDDYFEDLEALSSRSFLRSIEEAREDLRSGDTVALSDLFDG